MQKRICPICDHQMKHEHYCSFCRQWIKNPHYINATYYLNERHPAKETGCEYHNMGENISAKDGKTGYDTVSELLERAKTLVETHSTVSTDRSPGHQKTNQSVKHSNNTYQTEQRRTSVSGDRKRNKKPGIGIIKIILIIMCIMYAVNFIYNLFLGFFWWV